MKMIDSREVFNHNPLISNEDYLALDLVINNPLRLITKNLYVMLSKPNEFYDVLGIPKLGVHVK